MRGLLGVDGNVVSVANIKEQNDIPFGDFG